MAAALMAPLALSLVFAWLCVEVGARVPWTSRLLAGASLVCMAVGYVMAVVKMVHTVPGIDLVVSFLPVAGFGFLTRLYFKDLWQA